MVVYFSLHSALSQTGYFHLLGSNNENTIDLYSWPDFSLPDAAATVERNFTAVQRIIKWPSSTISQDRLSLAVP